MADLKTEICGLKLKNPIIPAAGPNVRDGKKVEECARGGAGALLTKTISIKAAPVPRPHMAIFQTSGMLNTELWSELPPEKWFSEEYDIAIEVKKRYNLPLIASIGYTKEEVSYLGPLVEKKGVDAIEFSIHYVAKESQNVKEIAQSLRNSVKIPIFAKLSPHFGDLGEVVRVIDDFVDGYVCINSFGPTLTINIEKVQPYMGSEFGYGWLSGSPIKPLALRCVFEVARRTNKPVIGVGGINKGEDVIEFFMVGASAVGVCTAAILYGNSVYGRIAKETSQWLDKNNYKSINDVKGLYLQKYKDGQKVHTEFQQAPKIILEKCVGCNLCIDVCEYDAIIPYDKYVSILEDKCFECGLCVSICPTGAIYF